MRTEVNKRVSKKFFAFLGKFSLLLLLTALFVGCSESQGEQNATTQLMTESGETGRSTSISESERPPTETLASLQSSQPSEAEEGKADSEKEGEAAKEEEEEEPNTMVTFEAEREPKGDQLAQLQAALRQPSPVILLKQWQEVEWKKTEIRLNESQRQNLLRFLEALPQSESLPYVSFEGLDRLEIGGQQLQFNVQDFVNVEEKNQAFRERLQMDREIKLAEPLAEPGTVLRDHQESRYLGLEEQGYRHFPKEELEKIFTRTIQLRLGSGAGVQDYEVSAVNGPGLAAMVAFCESLQLEP